METIEAIKVLRQCARPEILKEFNADSCIVSTAVGVDVLTHFGIFAEPLPVRTVIFNKPYVARIEAGSDWPKGDEIQRWQKEDGSYSVGIGVGTQQPNKWAGHLVILIEKKLLLDLSIDQASRPKYNMNFDEPLCVEVDKAFLDGNSSLTFRHDNGCIIRTDVLKNYGYTASPDWIFLDRRKKIIDIILDQFPERRQR